MSPAPKPDNLGLVQAFRGVAALAVALHHTAHRIQALPAIADHTRAFWLGRFVNPEVGAFGVDLFFIISGFIMTFTTPRQARPQAGPFLWRRFIRIYPLYWTCSLVAMAVLGSRWVQSLPTDPLAIAKSFALYPTLYLGTVRPVILSQGWTLIYEMLFYLVFAFTLRLSRVRQVPAVLALLGTLFATAWLLPGGAALQVLLRDQILFEFVLGMILGVLFCEYRFTWSRRTALGLAGLGLLLLAPSAFIPAYDWSIPRLLKFGLPAFLLIGGLLLHPDQSTWRIPHQLRLLGDASYSIYLTHTIVLLLFTTAQSRLAIFGQLPADLYFLLMAGTIVAAGYITYFAAERPLLRLARFRFARPPAPAPAPSS